MPGSRLNRKAKEVEEMTQAIVEIVNEDAGLSLHLDLDGHLWTVRGSAHELMTWLEGFLVGARFGRDRCRHE
jgi:hypothetical protein